MDDRLAGAVALVEERIGDRAGAWDVAGEIPVALLRELGAAGVLCAGVGTGHGGLGLTSLEDGALTARTGSLCSSVRSVATSQGMAAWSVRRLGTRAQREAYLPRLAGGALAAVAFTEPDAGSDLAAIDTRIEDGPAGTVTVSGDKRWVTAACYADLVVVFGRYRDGAAAVVVPTDAPGVGVHRVPAPSGCRAAGHADVALDGVRLPADALLGEAAGSLSLLVTTALCFGRLSVAWGCVGILRACLAAAAAHARTRRQFGRALAEHQLVARHLAELLAAEQAATRVCEHASRCWDARSADLPGTVALAKYVASRHASRGAAGAAQVLASAGAHEGHVVDRAHRDARLMEIIEGSSELCALMLAERVLERA